MEKYTVEACREDRLMVFQPAGGYRFSMDAVMLARHVKANGRQVALDIGTGCGIVALLLARRFPELRVMGVEIQKSLADAARHNIMVNHLDGQVRALHKDVRTIDPAVLWQPVDLIVSNPPYIKKDSGRLNPDHGRASARHEIHMTLEDLCCTSRRLLRTGGKLHLVYPAGRKTELLACLEACRLYPETLCFVHTELHRPAKRILVTAVKNGQCDCRVLAPVFVENG